jgi:alkaline phosphatase D
MLRVGWRISTDEQLRSVVARGTAVASPELAHSVHVEVSDVEPSRDYFYQFDIRDEESAVGHFRTAPGEHEMVGSRQEEWLASGLAQSRARWNLIGQQLLIAELEHTLPKYPDQVYLNDVWDGYPLARQRLRSDVMKTRVTNPVFLTGDWHSTFVNDLKMDFRNPASPTVATDFVTPALASGGDETPYGPYYEPMIPFNPHIKYYEGDKRGYFKVTVTPERMLLDLRFMTSVEDPNGTGYTQATWVVEDGRPGAKPA